MNNVKNEGKKWLINHPKLNPKSHNNIFRKITSPIRALPDFLIIGAQKSGTTSLYNYIVQHPRIREAYQKEVMFFDENFQKGLNYYKSFFPIRNSKKIDDEKFLTGEATVYYMYHPLVPKRVFELMPKVKIIIILRNPVDRAYSHYLQQKRRIWETESFEEAIKLEESRLYGEAEEICKNANYNSYNYKSFSYLSRGVYINQIKRWLGIFPKEQFLILKTEEMAKKPHEILSQCFKFLQVKQFKINNLDKLNVGSQSKMKEETRKFLIKYYEKYNNQLEELLQIKFDWNK